MKKRPINCAARNALWVYPRLVQPRFPGAPTITETTRSYDEPDLMQLPENSEVEVRIYGGAVTFRLDGWLHRVSTERFRWVRCADEAAARNALLELWRAVENMQSPTEVASYAAAWQERKQREDEVNTPYPTRRYKSM